MEFTKAKIYHPKTKSGKPSMNGRWYVYFHIRDHQGNLKMLKRKSGINTGTNVKERMFLAKALCDEINLMLERGYNFLDPSIRAAAIVPMMETLRSYLALKQGNIRTRTFQSYKYALDSLELYLTENKMQFCSPEEFNNYRAQDYCDYLQRSKRINPKTFNSTRAYLMVFFNMLVERELIGKNPFKSIKQLPEQAGRHLAYTNEEWEKLLSYLDDNNPRLKLFCQFIYYTYLRPIELLRLQVGNIDLVQGIIQIHGSQSKNRKSESVVIPDRFIEVVKNLQLQQLPKEYFLFGKKLQTDSQPYHRNSVTLQFRTALNKAGGFTSDHTLYSCKHTGVSAAYRLGVDIYAISRQCRHQTITETQNYMRSIGLQPNDEFRTKMK